MATSAKGLTGISNPRSCRTQNAPLRGVLHASVRYFTRVLRPAFALRTPAPIKPVTMRIRISEQEIMQWKPS